MAYSRIPGCSGCGQKTGHGGRFLPVGASDGADRYEVRQDGEVIGRFKSITAAATFMRGRPGSTVHPVTAA